MKMRLLAGAIVVALAGPGSVFASDMSVSERLAQMEHRLKYMEQRLADQDATIRAKDKQIAALSESQSGGWAPGVTVGGVVEFEASHTQTDGSGDTSDLNLATVEIGIEAKVNKWVSSTVVLLAEDINDSSVSVDVDEATITLQNSEVTPFYFTAGRMAMPFGSFETHMVTDPLTLDIGETKDAAALVGFEQDGFSAAAYLFNGKRDESGSDDEIDNGGVSLSYAWEGEGSRLNLGASYISDISESGISDTVANPVAEEVGGYGLFATYSNGPFSLIAEYVSAADSFTAADLAHNGVGAQPAAWNLEVGYAFDLVGHESTVAVGYQETDEASGLGLPEERLSLGLSVGLAENTSLNLEWTHDGAYAGGNDTDAATVQLAVEF